MKNKPNLLQVSRKFKSASEVPPWLLHRLPAAVQIRALRQVLGMTQMQLASRLGVRQGDIAKIEKNDAKDVRLSTLRKIAEGLGCELLTVLVPKEDIKQVIEKKALEAAKKLVAANTANMAMELQKPDAQMIKEEIQTVQEEMIRKRRSRLWDSDAK